MATRSELAFSAPSNSIPVLFRMAVRSPARDEFTASTVSRPFLKVTFGGAGGMSAGRIGCMGVGPGMGLTMAGVLPFAAEGSLIGAVLPGAGFCGADAGADWICGCGRLWGGN